MLDLAAGTGVSTVELGRSGAWCVATDFSKGMLKAGISRKVPMVAGDAMYLPYADNVFDAATISFGLRNVSDFEAGLREIARVTKPGGRLVVSEFSTPVFGPFRTVYMEYLMKRSRRSHAPSAATPTPTCTSPNRSAPGRPRKSWPARSSCRLEERQVAQPHRRHRGAALRHCLNCCAPLLTPGG